MEALQGETCLSAITGLDYGLDISGSLYELWIVNFDKVSIGL